MQKWIKYILDHTKERFDFYSKSNTYFVLIGKMYKCVIFHDEDVDENAWGYRIWMDVQSNDGIHRLYTILDPVKDREDCEYLWNNLSYTGKGEGKLNDKNVSKLLNIKL